MKVTLSKYRDWIGEIYGTYVTLGLILFFMVCYWTGLVHVRELRLLNLPIMIGGIYYALQQYKKVYGGINYFKAMTLGTYIGGIAALTFSTFLFIVFKLDHSFYVQVVKEGPMGEYMNVYIATSAVALEGVFSGMMATYLICNFIDTDKD